MHQLVFLGFWHAVKVESKLREQLAIVTLPLSDRLQVVGRSLGGLLGRGL
jgi:hypothetical protein